MARKKISRRTTVGVLFPGNARVYTYAVKLKHGIKLGDEVVVDSPFGGPKIVFVVRVDKAPNVPEGYDLETLKPIRGRVVPV